MFKNHWNKTFFPEMERVYSPTTTTFLKLILQLCLLKKEIISTGHQTSKTIELNQNKSCLSERGQTKDNANIKALKCIR